MNDESGEQKISWKEKLSAQESKELQKNTNKLAGLLHEEWREPRKKENGTFKPRMKKTKDEKWIKINGTNVVDIANTNYDNLPSDWQAENKASAEVAMDQIYKAKSNNENMDKYFIESASSVIHDEWLKRNGEWAPEEQKMPYYKLSDEEKQKDRAIIEKAIQIINK